MDEQKRMQIGIMKVCSGPMTGKEFFFEDGQIRTVGRSSKCDIRLDESYGHVSREHCSIAFDGQKSRFFVVDTSSRGVFNAQRQKMQGEGYIPANYILYLAGEGCKLQFSATEADVSVGDGSAGSSGVHAGVHAGVNGPGGYIRNISNDQNEGQIPGVEQNNGQQPVIQPMDQSSMNQQPIQQMTPQFVSGDDNAGDLPGNEKSGVSALTVVAIILGIAMLIIMIVIGVIIIKHNKKDKAGDAAETQSTETVDDNVEVQTESPD